MLGGIKGWMGAGKVQTHPEAAEDDIVLERDAAAAPVSGTVVELARDGAANPVRERWSMARIAAVEALWGEGFVSPGGAAEAVRLAKPLGLTSKASLLLVGGGTGGPAHTIAATFGTWVASLEAERVLSELATSRRAVADEAASRVTGGTWDRAAPAFPVRSSNHALSLESLRGTPPEPFIASISRALRPQGQLVMTELVADRRPQAADREFAAWCRLENRLPGLPEPEEVGGLLKSHNFDVRVAEDISDRHVAQTLAGWRDAVRELAAGPKPEAGQAAAFVTEAELWLLRIRLMRRLGLRLMRWHAIAVA